MKIFVGILAIIPFVILLFGELDTNTAITMLSVMIWNLVVFVWADLKDKIEGNV